MAWRYANETPAERRSTTSPGGACVSETQALVPRAGAPRPATRSPPPAARRGASRPSSTKSTRVASSSARRDAVLGEHDGRPEPLDGVEEERGGFGIELRGRLVEQQQLRLERERRREADPLQLAAGELDRLPPPEVQRVHRRERALDPRPDLGRRRRRDSRARTRPRSRRSSSRPGPPDPGRPSRPCRRARPGGCARVEAGDDDAAREAAAVEMRHEPGERAQQRRLARSRRGRGAPRPRRARARARRRAAPAARPGTRTRGRRRRLEPQRRHEDEQRAATSASRSRVLHGGRGARVAPGRPKPRASIASARLDARSSEPATSGESSVA